MVNNILPLLSLKSATAFKLTHYPVDPTFSNISKLYEHMIFFLIDVILSFCSLKVERFKVEKFRKLVQPILALSRTVEDKAQDTTELLLT